MSQKYLASEQNVESISNSQFGESFRVQTPTQNKRMIRQQLLPEQSIQKLLKLSNPQWQQLIEEFIRESFSTRPDTATTSIKLEQFNQSDINSRLIQFLLQKTQNNWQSYYKIEKSQTYQNQHSTNKNQEVSELKLEEPQISFKDFTTPSENTPQSKFQPKPLNKTQKVNNRYQQQGESELNQTEVNPNQQLESNYTNQQYSQFSSQPADSPTFIKRNKKIDVGSNDGGDISGNEIKQLCCWQWQSFEMFLQTINQQPKVDIKNILPQIRESDEKKSQEYEAQSSSKNKIQSIIKGLDLSRRNRNHRLDRIKENIPLRKLQSHQFSIQINQRKLLNYDEILKQLMNEINNQESVHLNSQPYLSKQPQGINKKYCCSFFRRRPPESLLMSQELVQEKFAILKLKDIQIDLQLDLHRSILLSISKGLGNYEKLLIPSKRWQIMGFQYEDPISEIKETGIFGLVQILFAITYFREVIILFYEIMKIYPNLRLGSLMIRISSLILKFLCTQKLDQLIILYKKHNCLNSLNQLFMAILYDIIKIQRTKAQPFQQQSIEDMLNVKENQDSKTIVCFVKQFTKNVDNLYKEIEL